MPRRALLALAIGLSLAVLAAGRARAQPHADSPAAAAFRDAARLLGDGDLDAAQAAFEAAAAIEPGGPWADDALSEAAGVAERRGDLAAAHRLWRRVLDEHPASRQARRARARLAALAPSVGDGGRWLAIAERHEALIREAARPGDPTPQVERLAALIAEHPAYPRATDARMWIGDAWLRLGRPRRAIAAYVEAAAGAATPAERWRAEKARGDALAVAGDLDDAERVYRALLGDGDALADRAIASALARLDQMRLRARLVVAAWIALALALALTLASLLRAAGGVRAAARALARPPIEVWYFVPVAAALLAVAATGNQLVQQAVRTILLGGLVTAWGTGAALDAARAAGRLRWPLALAHLVVAAVAVAAVCYLSLMNDRLLDMLAETWRHGHEH